MGLKFKLQGAWGGQVPLPLRWQNPNPSTQPVLHRLVRCCSVHMQTTTTHGAQWIFEREKPSLAPLKPTYATPIHGLRSSILIWPKIVSDCSVQVNCLHHYRFLKRNILLCGLWYSEDKPSNSAIHTFLRPLMTFLNHMYQEGKYSPYGTHITLLEVASQAEIRECNIYPTLFA